MEKKCGILTYNFITDRYEIIFGDGSINREITCGDYFEVLKGSKWYETSIEYDGCYYYTNNQIQLFEGQIVCI